MKSIYKFSSSKHQVLISLMVVVVILICSQLIFFYKVSDISVFFSNGIILIFGVLFYFSIMLLLIIQAIFNTRLYVSSYKNEQLEINNIEGYILYRVKTNDAIKEVRANYEDIYLIKRYKATFINLYYYEVFYTEKDVIKKIVVSISLATNLHKKIKKKVKLIKEEDVFCVKLPEPQSWLD